MRTFSIKELERFSGTRSHTIRIWESRYATCNPERSKGQIRHYTLDEVKHLLNITLLIKEGCRISKITKLSKEEVAQKINDLKTEEALYFKTINNLIICMFSNEIEEFETILDSYTFSYGIDVTLKKIIIPFLEKVQVLSYKDSSTEVHFIVTAIRKKIILGIEKSTPDCLQQKTALLFLPKDEHYDLLLLYIAYTLKCQGFRVLYLGTNISIENLEVASKEKKPDFIYTYTSKNTEFRIDPYKKILQQHQLHSKLFITTHNTDTLLNPQSDNIRYVHYNDVMKTI